MKSCLLVNRLLNTFSTNKKVSRIATVQKSLIPVEISHFCLYIYVPGGCEKQTWETSRCPDASEMPLQWSNYTHPNLYLLESHARSASLLTCLCGGLGYGTRYSWCAWLTDWPATAAILGVWGYISRVLAFLFIYLFIYFHSAVSYWQNSDVHQYYTLQLPPRKNELLGANGGLAVERDETAGRTRGQKQQTASSQNLLGIYHQFNIKIKMKMWQVL